MRRSLEDANVSSCPAPPGIAKSLEDDGTAHAERATTHETTNARREKLWSLIEDLPFSSNEDQEAYSCYNIRHLITERKNERVVVNQPPPS